MDFSITGGASQPGGWLARATHGCQLSCFSELTHQGTATSGGSAPPANHLGDLDKDCPGTPIHGPAGGLSQTWWGWTVTAAPLQQNMQQFFALSLLSDLEIKQGGRYNVLHASQTKTCALGAGLSGHWRESTSWPNATTLGLPFPASCAAGLQLTGQIHIECRISCQCAIEVRLCVSSP